jgi:uncharacterized protein (UPF0303 family)
MKHILKEEWLKIVLEQEERLLFGKFDREDVLALAESIIDLARNQYGHVSIRVVYDNITTFYYLMEGTTLNNDWWMAKKLNVCMKTGASSLLSALEFEHGGKECPQWAEEEGNYALVGGCIPIRLKDGEIKGYAMVSALEHQMDHQLIADAMAGMLGINIPSIE